jgi:hypothetical protein
MPNQVSPVVEQAILDYISVWPTHGPRRIAQELAQPQWGGHLISHWGVQKTPRRQRLHKRLRALLRLPAPALPAHQAVEGEYPTVDCPTSPV